MTHDDKRRLEADEEIQLDVAHWISQRCAAHQPVPAWMQLILRVLGVLR